MFALNTCSTWAQCQVVWPSQLPEELFWLKQLRSKPKITPAVIQINDVNPLLKTDSVNEGMNIPRYNDAAR